MSYETDFVSVTADGSPGNTFAESQCFQVQYAHPERQTVVRTGWMSLAVLFGPLLALGAAVLTFRLCCKRYWYQELTIEEERLANEQQQRGVVKRVAWRAVPFHMQTRLRKTTRGLQTRLDGDDGFDVAYGRLIEPDQLSAEALQHSTSSRHQRRHSSGASIKQQRRANDGGGPRVHYGLADMIIEPSTAGTDNLPGDHSHTLADSLELDLLASRSKMSEAVLHAQLNQTRRQQPQAGLDTHTAEALVEDYMAGLAQDEQALTFEMHMAIKELDENGEPLTEERKRQLKADFRQRRHLLFKESLDNLRSALRDDTKLSDAHIDDIHSKMSKNLTEIERIMANALDQRIEFLYKQHVEREHVSRLIAGQAEEAQQLEAAHEEIIEDIVNDPAVTAKVPPPQRDKMRRRMREELKQQVAVHDADLKAQLGQQKEKARRKRTEKLEELREKQTDEMQQLVQRSKTKSDPVETLQAVEELTTKHTKAEVKLRKQLDRDEAEDITKIHEAANQQLASRLGHSVANQTEELRPLLTEKELASIRQKHSKKMQTLQEKRRKLRAEEERLAAKTLAEQKKRVENALTQHHMALDKINDTNNVVVERVATAQPTFDDRDKQRLLNEHEHNRKLLASLFKLTKFERDQILQQKLAERRRKFEAQQRNSNNLESHLEGDLDAEKAALEAEQTELIGQMRQQMSDETQDLLEAQQSRMAHVIGMLQVGHARRQAAIERQMQMVTRLETLRKQELEVRERAREQDVEVSHDKLTDLLEKHKEQVARLQRTLTETRERQLAQLQQRYNRIRQEKASTVDGQYEGAGESIIDEAKLTKPSVSRARLTANVVDASRERAQWDAELTADAHFAREKTKLNLERQRELEEALLVGQSDNKEQKQQFLEQLASLINLSSEELRARSRAASQNRLRSLQGSNANISQAGSNVHLDEVGVSNNVMSESSATTTQQMPKLPPLKLNKIAPSVDSEVLQTASDDLSYQRRSSRKRDKSHRSRRDHQ